MSLVPPIPPLRWTVTVQPGSLVWATATSFFKSTASLQQRSRINKESTWLKAPDSSSTSSLKGGLVGLVGWLPKGGLVGLVGWSPKGGLVGLVGWSPKGGLVKLGRFPKGGMADGLITERLVGRFDRWKVGWSIEIHAIVSLTHATTLLSGFLLLSRSFPALNALIFF